MGTQRRLWRQYLREHQVGTLITLALAVAGVFIFAGYWWKWDWTGFYAQSIPNGSLAPKTLWDWMHLFIIPAVLALGAYMLNQAQQARTDRAAAAEKQRDREAAEARAKLESESREDTQHETALQTYIDKMSELLLHENLRNSAEEDKKRKIARVRTLTILRRLDAARNRTLLDFLFESDLLRRTADRDIIELQHANLSQVELEGADLHEAKLQGANLFNADLHEAKLQGAKLQGANLWVANLTGADLHGADLHGADLRGADLRGANLSGATLNGAVLREAKYNRGIIHEGMYKMQPTQWPQGFNLDSSGMLCVDC